MNNKEIEKSRYNDDSIKKIKSRSTEDLKIIGADNFSMYLRPPYLEYHNKIKSYIAKKNKILQLDLCCGDGIHSFTGAIEGADVIALDFAEKSVEICKKRNSLLNLKVEFSTADVQTLSFEDEKFDIVTCVGSLSYLDNSILFDEIRRVLKNGGLFLCLDSFNHNPIYRLNRFIHYLSGNRTYSTLTRMPNKKTLHLLEKYFSNVKVSYFGIFIFIVPLLNFFISPDKITLILSRLDQYFCRLNRFAFKVVIEATK